MRLSTFFVAVLLAVAFCSAPSGLAWFQRGAAPIPTTRATVDATARLVAAANAFLATLNEAERARGQFLAGDKEQSQRWSNFPTGIFSRTGWRIGDLTPAQRTAALSLLQVALSREGYRKVMDIVRGDEVLRASDTGGAPGGRGGRGPAGGRAPAAGGQGAAGAPAPGGQPGRAGRGGALVFGEAEYYLSFVGPPSTTAPWLLQFGGHHLAINLTVAGGRSSMTPSLPAAQPATFTIDGQSIRPLGDEHGKAFALVGTLDASQRAKAILPTAVSDLVLGPGKDGQVIQPEGLPGADMSPAQREALLSLIDEWAGIVSEPFAQVRSDELRANLPETYFAWSGPTTPGSVAYYRIQGPTLVIEYAPQGSVDHIHTIYRDPTNDYGARLAAR